MNTYKIEVTTTDYPEIYGKYMAVFEDYDAAPIDHETPSDYNIGYGDTEIEAMYDLMERSL